MKKPSLVNPTTSLAMGVCLLALSAGVAFADNLHPTAQANGTTNGTGQVGSNVLSSCSPSMIPNSIGLGFSPGGSGSANNPAGTNGSPFNLSVTKNYAGNCGSPTAPGAPTCPSAGQSSANRNTAVSQYDIACAQQSLH
jgi:hypothetical protein